MAQQETESERAERQARLSQAMGRLFLKERVAKMEDEANVLEFKRSAALPAKQARGDSGKQAGTRSPGERKSSERSREHSGKTQASCGPLATRIIDVSLLIYSLRTLHEWIKEGRYILVIPLEALNVLDVLKKGDAPVNVAARKATRFLDDKIGSSVSLKDGKPGLVAQGEQERIRWLDIVAYYSPADPELNSPALRRRTDDEARQEGARLAEELLAEMGKETPLSLLKADALSSARSSSDSRRSNDSVKSSNAPLHVRETLTCMAWFESIVLKKDYVARAEERTQPCDDKDIVALAVAYPPPGENVARASPDPATRFNVRADGRLMQKWADAFDMNVVVAPTAASWMSLATGAPQAVPQHTSKSAAALADHLGEEPRSNQPKIIFS